MIGRRLPGKAPQAVQRKQLDLFGQLPITRFDVYAWLLAVAEIDPASQRAAKYVRDYCVVEKIALAKLNGTFDSDTAAAHENARYRELVMHDGWKQLQGNALHLGDWESLGEFTLTSKRRKAKHRPAEVIKREKDAIRQERLARQSLEFSVLARLPRWTPALSVMLADIGSPSPRQLAAAMQVTARTARQWIEADDAPLPVKLALFWLTRWGTSVLTSNAHNDAVMGQQLAAVRGREVDALKERAQKLQRIADFGSANDPALGVSAAAPAMPMPAVRLERPLVFTEIRRVKCAA